jgi:hypothetical protein
VRASHALRLHELPAPDLGLRILPTRSERAHKQLHRAQRPVGVASTLLPLQQRARAVLGLLRLARMQQARRMEAERLKRRRVQLAECELLALPLRTDSSATQWTLSSCTRG